VLVSDHLGEVARLPGALRWHIDGTRVDHYQIASEAQARYVIEVGVAAAEVPHVVAELRELGHEVLRVRAPRAHEAPPEPIEPLAPLALPGPPGEIPWQDSPGRDAGRSEVARHGSRSDHADEASGPIFGWEFRR
jgi:hypothetical protein